MRLHLLTPVKSLQKHVSSIQEKQNTDKLCVKLEELSKRIEEQESGYNDVVLRMLETNVYMMLATIQTTDYNLFNQLTIYFKKLVTYTLQEDCLYTVNQVGEIFGCHLHGFTKYPLLVAFQLPYINRLIANIIRICKKYPIILQIWILPDGDSKLATLFQSLPNNTRLPMYQIIKNFLVVDSPLDQTENVVELISLTKVSNCLDNWFLQNKDLVNLLSNKCSNSIFQMKNLDSRFHNVTEFAKYFKMFCLIVENCTPQIAQTYYNFFETQVLNVVLHNEIRHQHQLAFSVLQTIAEITTIKTMERVFDNECFTSWIKIVFEEVENLPNLFISLSNLFSKHEEILVKLMATKIKPSDEPYSIEDLRLKAMKVCKRDTTEISSFMATTLKHQFKDLRMYSINTITPITKVYLQVLLEYFQNTPAMNEALNTLSSILMLKLNFFDNKDTRIVIEFLFDSYFNLRLLLEDYMLYRFDSIELQNHRIYQDCFKQYHKSSDQQQLNEDNTIKNTFKDINYLMLEQNLQLFETFTIQLYVYFKLKHIAHNWATEIPDYSVLLR